MAGYCHRKLVLCVPAKGGGDMRNIIEELYYGNITPCDRDIIKGGSCGDRQGCFRAVRRPLIGVDNAEHLLCDPSPSQLAPRI